MSCCAVGCTNRTSKKIVGVTFHKFPKNEKIRSSWIKAVSRYNWTPSYSSVLCSQHFSEDRMDRTSCCTVRIRENAVPNIFKRISALKLNKNSKKIPLCFVPYIGAELPEEDVYESTNGDESLMLLCKEACKESENIQQTEPWNILQSTVKTEFIQSFETESSETFGGQDIEDKNCVNSSPACTEINVSQAFAQNTMADQLNQNLMLSNASTTTPLVIYVNENIMPDQQKNTLDSNEQPNFMDPTQANSQMNSIEENKVATPVNKNISPASNQQPDTSDTTLTSTDNEIINVPQEQNNGLLQFVQKLSLVNNVLVVSDSGIPHIQIKPKKIFQKAIRASTMAHTYSLNTAPEISTKPRVSTELEVKASLEKSRETIVSHKRKIRMLQQSNRRFKKKVDKQNATIEELEHKCVHAEKTAKIMEATGLEKEFLQRQILQKLPGKSHYSEELRIFAATLYACSPRAYNYVRSRFSLFIPHSRTVMKWNQMSKRTGTVLVSEEILNGVDSIITSPSNDASSQDVEMEETSDSNELCL